MENKDINSCLMLGVNLMTPVDLGCIFDTTDLKDTGVELDSHITLLFAQGKMIDRYDIMPDIKTILGDEDYRKLLNLCKQECTFKVLNFFDLSSFENDSDYIILKLKKNTDFYLRLFNINKGLKSKYNVSSDFNNYTPHISLAELQPGTAKKYLDNGNLKLILNETYIDFEDIFISYGGSGEVDRKQYFLTKFKCLERYFRTLKLKVYNEELMKE
jgi:hypothetical protein